MQTRRREENHQWYAWISDLNAMYQSIARVLRPGGLSVLYELHPFFVKNEDVISGNMPSREEIDRMYTLEHNPGMALPEMMCVVSRK